jgi:hypothetical protein
MHRDRGAGEPDVTPLTELEKFDPVEILNQ